MKKNTLSRKLVIVLILLLPLTKMTSQCIIQLSDASCDSGSTAINYPEWIFGVEFENIINTSSSNCDVLFGNCKSFYSDFTNNFTTDLDLTDGMGIYNINITIGYNWQTFDEYFRIWIDFNDDGDFSDMNEQVIEFMEPAPNIGTAQLNVEQQISIPDNITFGNKRMRISMKRGGYPGPCESFMYGEVEDYRVNIITENTPSPSPTLSANCNLSQISGLTDKTAGRSDISDITDIIPAISEKYNNPSPYPFGDMIGVNNGILAFQNNFEFNDDDGDGVGVNPISELTTIMRNYHVVERDFNYNPAILTNTPANDDNPADDGIPLFVSDPNFDDNTKKWYEDYAGTQGFTDISFAIENITKKGGLWTEKMYYENEWADAGITTGAIQASVRAYAEALIDNYSPANCTNPSLAQYFEVGNELWGWPEETNYHEMIKGVWCAMRTKYGEDKDNWEMKLVSGSFQAFSNDMSDDDGDLQNVPNEGGRYNYIGNYLDLPAEVLEDLHAINVHPYSFIEGSTDFTYPEKIDSEFNQIKNLVVWRDANFGDDTPIGNVPEMWSTEFGFDSYTVGELTQSAYSIRGLLIQARYHYSRVYFYNAYDSQAYNQTFYGDTYATSGLWQVGIHPDDPPDINNELWSIDPNNCATDPDNGHCAQPKPVWYGLLDFKDKFTEHIFHKAIYEGDNLYAYILTTLDGTEPYLVFWNPIDTIEDDNGNNLYEISDTPIYIEMPLDLDFEFDDLEMAYYFAKNENELTNPLVFQNPYVNFDCSASGSVELKSSRMPAYIALVKKEESSEAIVDFHLEDSLENETMQFCLDDSINVIIDAENETSYSISLTEQGQSNDIISEVINESAINIIDLAQFISDLGVNFQFEVNTYEISISVSNDCSSFSDTITTLNLDIVDCNAERPIAGNVAIWCNDVSAICGVTITITGTNGYTETTVTDEFGNYQFEYIPLGDTYTITASKQAISNDEYVYGLSYCDDESCDTQQITEHILLINQFDNPFSLIAADVNNSSSITALDNAIIASRLEGNQAFPLPSGTWCFTADDYIFQNPNNPFSEIPQASTITITDNSTNLLENDFNAIKKGDVDCSYEIIDCYINNRQIGGNISLWCNNESHISGVNVTITGSAGFTATVITDNQGDYLFNNVPLGDIYTITAQKDSEILCGLTSCGTPMCDTQLIQNHVLMDLMGLFNSPFQIIAADVNNSSGISTFDAALIDDLIQGEIQQLPSSAWAFTAKSYMFQMPNNPFSELPNASIILIDDNSTNLLSPKIRKD